MPLKKDKENTEIIKETKVKKRTTRRVKEKKEDKFEQTKTLNIKINYNTLIKIIWVVLLIANLIIGIIILQKINQTTRWTLLYNWWEENYNKLNNVYWSQAYKEYIDKEIKDLEKQLIENKENP